MDEKQDTRELQVACDRLLPENQMLTHGNSPRWIPHSEGEPTVFGNGKSYPT
jgi:hypothetical protein